MWSVLAGAIIFGLIAFFTIMFQLVQHWYLVVPIGFVIWVWTFLQLDEVKAVVKYVRTRRQIAITPA